jgi:predicted ATPase
MTAGLLERDAELRRLRETLRGAGQGRGSVVLVSGEAGIGKTVLVRRFAREAAARARVLVGACDDLVTPRTLGPFRDMARDTGGALAEAVEPGAGREAVFGAVHQELAGRPTVLVVEDVHWADDATLDVLRYLAWRIPGLPCVLVLTYRDDELGEDHPLRRVLGAHSPTGRCGGWGCGRCRRARSRSWPAATAPTPPRCSRSPPATPSS